MRASWITIILATILTACSGKQDSSEALPTCLEDLAGHTVAVPGGGATDLLLSKYEGINLMRIGIGEMALAVKSGRAEYAMIQEDQYDAAKMDQQGFRKHFNGIFKGSVAVAFRMDEEKVCDDFNQFLREMRASGEYDKWHHDWLQCQDSMVVEAVKMPLQINHMTAALGKLHIGMTTDAVHAGYLDLMHTNARIANISNTPGSTMHAALTTHFAGGGDIRVATDMTVNKRCALTFDADLTNVKGSSLTTIAKPLYGVELGCNFHSISTRCRGDIDTLGGTFCMRYDSLKLHVDDNGPVKELSSLSGLINTFATVVLFDKNPRFPDQEPKAFTVKASYDPMQPFPAYFIAAIVDGMAQTVMPFGLGKGIMNKKKP